MVVAGAVLLSLAWMSFPVSDLAFALLVVGLLVVTLLVERTEVRVA